MQPGGENPQPRKIIHVDMDCFYAAIELREHPELAGKAIAVGGRPGGRGVLTTCNYEARKFGCRSAMPSFKALERCPALIILPVRHDLYRSESMKIRSIFAEFTSLVEPLSLDEAYLDLTGLKSSGSAVAEEIRFRIKEETSLAGSAGVAPNKLLAKIASDWNKPDGQFEILEDEIPQFMQSLPVNKIWGVGDKTAARLESLGATTCGELQEISLVDLHRTFGQFGAVLFQLCRGIDDRKVTPNRERKSLSVERTFRADLVKLDEGTGELGKLIDELAGELSTKHSERTVRAAFVKVKFTDFQQTTAECRAVDLSPGIFEGLLEEGWRRGEGKSVRLLGVGVRFEPQKTSEAEGQLELF
ncbi:MAG: DNA polymerase IV [Verrucomicrobiales bacterium]